MSVFNIDNSFTASLPADANSTNIPRQVEGACFSYVNPVRPSHPQLIAASKAVGALLGMEDAYLNTPEFLHLFSGHTVLSGTRPYAMCYAGHQFGQWAGQLGDGRAINLFELLHNEQRWMLQLKGAGPTPYARRADGLAVLRSSIREYLCSEAMHYLGVPTTRALSLVLTGDDVLRDMMYDGNAAYEKGAVVCRVAPTFIRFGSFQVFTWRKDIDNLRKLTDYTIQHYFPEAGAPSKAAYIRFFERVCEETLNMILHWQRVGFVHGVMNTDNMSILGVTIDYGPYGWLDDYNPGWTPNTTDAAQHRYRYGNQPAISQWNLMQLANALYPLIEDAEPLKAALTKYQHDFEAGYEKMMRQKLGLQQPLADDEVLIEELERILTLTETDMTIFFRNLPLVKKETDITTATAQDLTEPFANAFYTPLAANSDVLAEWEKWMKLYVLRLRQETAADEERQTQMNLVNPKYVLRNYMAQLAIDKADDGDYSLVKALETMLMNPYAEQPEYEEWFTKRPDWARDKAGCSALSCSS
jgi:serine/tyrosine/threonine adenylyltransferase